MTKSRGSKAVFCILVLFFAVIIHASPVKSSTFIGNGGDTQDLDLGITLSVINSIATRLTSPQSESLCTCSDEWQENDLCRMLRQQTPEQVNACRDTIQKHSRALAALSKRDSIVTFEWSQSELFVKGVGSSAANRPVDAVTQTKEGKIIIDRRRFNEMPMSFRVALITHELFHLISFDGAYLNDEQAVPPFSSGRDMLNTLGAALAMEANEQGVFNEFVTLKNVSRAAKNHRIYLEGRGVSHNPQVSKRLLRSSNSASTALGYTYEFSRIAVGILFEGILNKGMPEGIRVEESLSMTHVNTQFRFFPITKKLSRFNEMYLSLGLSAGAGGAKYTASTSRVKISDKAPVVALGGLFRAHIPLNHGIWIITGADFRHVKYEYKKLNISGTENQTLLSIGASYGF